MIVEIDAAGSGKDEHETSPRGTTIPAKSSWDTWAVSRIHHPP